MCKGDVLALSVGAHVRVTEWFGDAVCGIVLTSTYEDMFVGEEVFVEGALVDNVFVTEGA